jgi:hypothetical protein
MLEDLIDMFTSYHNNTRVSCQIIRGHIEVFKNEEQCSRPLTVVSGTKTNRSVKARPSDQLTPFRENLHLVDEI